MPGTDHLRYFSALVPALNVVGAGFVGDPFKVERPAAEPADVRTAVDAVYFGCGFVAVHKLVRPHWVTGGPPPTPLNPRDAGWLARSV